WTGGKERIPDILDGSFNASLLVTAGRSASTRLEVIMGSQLQQPRMKADRIAEPLQHSGFKIVIENEAWRIAPVAERVNMTAKEVFQRLIEEELQIERPGVRQCQDETR